MGDGLGSRPSCGPFGGYSRASTGLGKLYLNHNIRQISIHIFLLDSERNIPFPRGMGVPTPTHWLQSQGSQSVTSFPLRCTLWLALLSPIASHVNSCSSQFRFCVPVSECLRLSHSLYVVYVLCYCYVHASDSGFRSLCDCSINSALTLYWKVS